MPARIDLTALDCIAYIRVSTEAQSGEKQTSLADQRAAVAALAAKLGRTIGHVFEDAGLSGASIEYRPGLQSLIASCEAAPKSRRRPGLVLCLNDSRFGRFPNSEEATYWRVHLEKQGWTVRFAEFDDVQDDQVRPILRSINQSQASLYRRNLQANTKRGAKGTAEQGFWQAQAPFGYLRHVVFPASRERTLDHHTPKASDEKIVLVPHPDEAPIVRTIFERYAGGTESLSSIVEWAVAAWPNRKWSRASVRFLLTNPAYVGDVVWGRMPGERNERGKRAWRPDAEWYGKANAHEPLVSRTVFARALDRLRLNKRQTRGVRSDWVVSGIVQCRCGQHFAGGGMAGTVRKTGRRLGPVYRCSTRGAHPSARCPYPGTVMKWMLEEAVLSTLGDVIGSVAHQRMMRAAIDKALRASRNAARTVEQIDKDTEAVKQKQRRLVVAIEADAVSTIEARERMTELRRALATLTAERERVVAAAERGALPEAQRDALLAIAMDFRGTLGRLQGPSLRELIRPWIKRAVFNTETRELTMEIRRVPAADIVLDQPGYGSAQKSGHDLTVKRTVRVGGRR